MTNTSDTISQQDFEDAVCDRISIESFRRDYSGRGMYGSSCFGFISDGSTARDTSAELRKAADRIREDIEGDEGDLDWEEEEALIDKLEALAVRATDDNMGLSLIIYFPGWTLED